MEASDAQPEYNGRPNSSVCVLFPPVENESHCDFVKLREMLIRVNMEDLREQTHARHYELYRRCKLEEMGFKDTDPDSQPFRWGERERANGE